MLLSSETKQKTLEEIAAAFGDKVVLPTRDDFAGEPAIFKDDKDEDTYSEQQVESADAAV